MYVITIIKLPPNHQIMDKTFKELTRAGIVTANLIAEDAVNKYLSSDGLETFNQLGDVLIKINKYGGMVTDSSQGTSTFGANYFQRPYISIITHVSHMKMFYALATEDNITININDVLPVTWTWMTEDELFRQNKRMREKPNSKHRALRYDDEKNEYLYRHTQTGHPDNNEEELNLQMEGRGNYTGKPFRFNNSETVYVFIVWTKTSGIDDFVKVLNKYFANYSNCLV